MNCTEGTQYMTTQICSLLKLIDDEDYSKPLDIFNGSTLGQHFRHILDFYNMVLKGVVENEIDYSKRERNPKVELDTAYANNAFCEVAQQVAVLDEQKSIQVRADFSNYHDENRPTVPSSVGRELMFAYDHAVHHLAIIKIGIRSTLPHLKLDENLGVAPATIKFQKGESASNG